MQDFEKWLQEDIAYKPHMMQGSDIENLGLLAQGRDTIIEIGAFVGTMTRVFCSQARKVYTVDWFQGEKATGFWKDHDEVFAAYCENNKADIESGKLTVYRMRSEEAAPLLKAAGVMADMIYIDADHTYEGCKADIENYLPMLKPGGLMCGHDIGGFPGVTKAVMEAFPNAMYFPTLLWTWSENAVNLGKPYQLEMIDKETIERLRFTYLDQCES